MTEKALCFPENQGGSAAAKKTYSAKELAEMFIASRVEFYGIDLTEATNDWSLNIIYEFLYELKEPNYIDEAIEWLIIYWEDANHIGEPNSLVFDDEKEANRQRFKGNLLVFKERIIDTLKRKKHKEELMARARNGYNQDTTTSTGSLSTKAAESKPTVTTPPVFPPKPQNNDEEEVKSLVKLEDLPESVRNKVVVSQKVFDVYVKQLNEDLWLTVMTNKTKLCGCLFFLSNFHHITSRDTKPEEYALLLQHVVTALKGKGSVVSSIRRRDEVLDKKIDRSYKCYVCADVSPSMENEIYKLRNDCKELLEGFQPVLEAMEEEKNAKDCKQAERASNVA